MLFMVIERFKGRDARRVYERFQEEGRMLPEGLEYIDSWIEANFDRCFQLMRCDDAALLQEWALRWHDLVEFDFIPVVSSRDTADRVNSLS
jgi:hypothetical protein